MPSADGSKHTIRPHCWEMNMSLAHRAAPAADLSGHRCIRWAMEEEDAGKTPGEMVSTILDSFASRKSELVMLFCSPQFHIAEVASAVGEYGLDAHVVGCTTAGEITPRGHRRGSIIGVSFDAEHFVASVKPIERLCDFEIAAGFATARALLAEQEVLQQRLEMPHTFAMLINDSL